MPHRRPRLTRLVPGLMVAALVLPLVNAGGAQAAGCGTYRCSILNAATAVSELDGAANFAAWILGEEIDPVSWRYLG